MRIRCGYEISFDCPAPTPMLLCLSVHPERRDDLETPDWVRTDPFLDVGQYIDGFGNIASRVLAPAGRTTFSADFVIRDSGLIDDYAPEATQALVQDLPTEVLVYLLGSRYCETDRLSDIAWALFGQTEPGWARVQAIVDFVHHHIKFDYMQASNTRSAYGAYEDRVGVCRDYAHLAIALCRCMNIPTRYCTGYLGDIWVPLVGEMDFSAWMEVWLDGRWYTFDARNNKRRVGRVLMARGRDATDVPIANIFGNNVLSGFTVMASEVVEPVAAV